MAREEIVGLVLPLIAVLFASVFLILWIRTRQGAHLLTYAFSYTMLACGFLTFHLFTDPTSVAATLMMHGCYSIGCMAMIAGFCRRSKRSFPLKAMAFAAVISMALLLMATATQADMNARLYVANMFYGLVYAVGAMALGGGAAKDPMRKVLTWIFAATSAQFFIRPTMSFVLAGIVTADDYRDSPYYAILVVTLAFFSLATALSLLGSFFYDQLSSDRAKAERDVLSGLFLRQPFEQRAIAMLERAKDAGVPVSMVVADIDLFKRVNDIWGHQAGDEAIAAFGRLIGGTVREGDLAGRIGGEEFCILVWNCTLDPSIGLADRIRRKFTAQEIAQLGADTRLTASFGVATWKIGEGYGKFFARADAALYRAKGEGRDCVRADGDTAEVEQQGQPVALARPAAA
ncbi:GGDEF domain-containing protein [Alteriqipengyuania sp. WL0013]|uniref:GGDEF domain-containing protein n=1 Tax=Alteriqipengyuania sp. WL0013 TaxID=3110773 RepID=UPI002C9A7E19|nr:GGDEF domain-containing protein [Alteriqipengyuania sp. WL0013]MEB3415358.1 GGDEF domain-containing protein [Alteriqipengyuania sp. WL0013]